MQFVYSIPARQDNYIHALIDSDTNEVWLVDPSESKPVFDWLVDKPYQLKGIYITHHHYDHIDGVPELISQFKIPVYAPKYNQVQIPFADYYLSGDEKLTLGQSFKLDVIYSPGHTQGHILYYEPIQKWLFCGDTFFNLSCGRIFDGTPEQLFDSLQKIKKLDSKTLLFTAHEYTLSGFTFCLSLEPNNEDLLKYYKEVLSLREQNKPSVPIELDLALKVNPYLKAKNYSEFAETRQRRQDLQT